MTVLVDLQIASALTDLPGEDRFSEWIEAALRQSHESLEQTLRIVDEAESRDLNLRYRGVDKPTNVLAFESRMTGVDYACLGDLVLCAPVVLQEARQQQKPLDAHWAHLVIHGMLHLQGFDHQQAEDRTEMERLEIKILHGLGYANPYTV